MEGLLPPGFRFYPTEEELVSFYLQKKLEDGGDDLNRVMDRVIPVLDIYEFHPLDLPQFAGAMCRKDPEQWFFFIPRQESEARGGRPRRRTTTGYWKATGSPGFVYSSSNRSIGVKRTMVFYNGRAPTGTKTDWKMNEYKAINAPAEPSSSTSALPQLRHEFSLCRIYKKSKTVRSFDRRPPQQELDQLARSAMNEQKASNLPLMEERESSPDNSTSKEGHGHGHGHSSPTSKEKGGEDDANYGPMWDWEKMI